jgi:microcystin-dependent protein
MIAKGKASKKKTGKHSGDVQGENLEIGLMSSELTMHTHDAVCTYQPASTTAVYVHYGCVQKTFDYFTTSKTVPRSILCGF